MGLRVSLCISSRPISIHVLSWIDDVMVLTQLFRVPWNLFTEMRTDRIHCEMNQTFSLKARALFFRPSLPPKIVHDVLKCNPVHSPIL